MKNTSIALLFLALATGSFALDLPAVQQDAAIPPQFYLGEAHLTFIAPRLLTGTGEAHLPEAGLTRTLKARFPGAHAVDEQVFVTLPTGQEILIGTLGDVDLKMPFPGRRVVPAPGVTVQVTHNGVWVEVSDR